MVIPSMFPKMMFRQICEKAEVFKGLIIRKSEIPVDIITM